MRNKITVNELMSAQGALKTFHIFDRVLIGEGRVQRGPLISKFSKIGIQIFNMRFKVKCHLFIFKKYRIFNIGEHI